MEEYALHAKQLCRPYGYWLSGALFHFTHTRLRDFAMLSSLLHVETLTSQPVRIEDVQLRVRSQVVQLRLPVASGGLIWNRPVAVLVHTPDGEDQILPISDVTRTAVLSLVGICFAGALLLMLSRRKTV
jgi:hypothetical protein